MRGVRTPYPEPFKPSGRNVYYFNYNDPRTGERRRRSTGCSRIGDATAEVKRFMDALASETSPEMALSFGEYAAPFFLDGQCPRQSRAKDEREQFSERHMRDLRHGLERVIGRPALDRKEEYPPRPFSKLRLGKITRSDVYALRRELSRDPGGRAGQRCFTAVKTVLAEATIRGHLTTSPADGIGPYKRPEAGSGEAGAVQERGAFSLEEIRALWAHRYDLTASRYSYARGFGREKLRDTRHGVALALLIGMGLRVGELRALRWRHIDMDSGLLDVIEAVKDQTAGSPIGPPKRGKLRRGLSIPGPVLEDLQSHRENMRIAGEQYVSADTPIITDADGGIVGPTWVGDMWRRVKSAAPDYGIDFGDRWLTPHSCRHSLNTWLLIEGAPPLQVQEFLGWESEAGKALAAMQHHYGHFELAGTRKVAEYIEGILSPQESAATPRDSAG